MEKRYCENKDCGRLIPETRRKDAIYCTDRCGWTHRNIEKNTRNSEKRRAMVPLETNYKIIKDFYERGIYDLSKETLVVSGFDFGAFTGINEIDHTNNTTEYNLFEYSYKIHTGRITIKKDK